MSELFTTVQADPGWKYKDLLRQSKTIKRSSVDQYKTTMTVEEICNLYTPSRIEHEAPLPTLRTRASQHYIPGRLCGYDLAETGFLWLWCTPTTLLDGSAVTVARHWGYEPKQIGVWIKGRIEVIPPGVRGTGTDLYDAALILQIGMGWATRGVVEFFLIATRGKYTKLIKNKGQSNLILAPEDAVILAGKREHSRKPDEIYDRIEAVCPGPYLELFSRSGRPGWTSYGDEVGKFSDYVAASTGPLNPSAPAPSEPERPPHRKGHSGEIYALLAPDDDGVYQRHDHVLPDPGLADQWPS